MVVDKPNSSAKNPESGEADGSFSESVGWVEGYRRGRRGKGEEGGIQVRKEGYR